MRINNELFLQKRGKSTIGRPPFLARVALIYPNYYYVGMSNLGFQTVYNMINSIDGFRCERAFLPGPGRVSYRPDKILTIETQTPIERFDIIAFSISFENDALSILTIIESAGLKLLSKERSDEAPLILAGGVLCSLNPEPLALFIDCFLLGEVEKSLKLFLNKFDPAKKKKNLTDMVCQIPNLYVPAFFKPKYSETGLLESLNTSGGVPKKVERSVTKDLYLNPTNTSILTKNTVFKNTFLIEVSRGCHHGCRFCGAGYVYRPTRFQSQEIIEKQINYGIKLTRNIGLIGSTILDHPSIVEICSKQENVNFSFSSVRIDNVTSKLIELLKKNKTKTITVAPEAGSERLRKVINKNITEEQILSTTEKLVSGGILNLKMYFIIGLPTETTDDIKSIITLCKKVKDSFLQASRSKRKIGRITVSLNPFIPKPFTPFQWAEMNEVSSLKKKIDVIRQGLKKVPNLDIQIDSTRKAPIQALIARGNRKTAKILLDIHKNNHNWPKVLKQAGKNPDFRIYCNRHLEEILPWDFLDSFVKKELLVKEYKLAMNNKTSQII